MARLLFENLLERVSLFYRSVWAARHETDWSAELLLRRSLRAAESSTAPNWSSALQSRRRAALRCIAGALAVALLILSCLRLPAFALDLSKASVVVPPDLSGPGKKAVTMLIEEVEKRTQIHWANAS